MFSSCGVSLVHRDQWMPDYCYGPPWVQPLPWCLHWMIWLVAGRTPCAHGRPWFHSGPGPLPCPGPARCPSPVPTWPLLCLDPAPASSWTHTHLGHWRMPTPALGSATPPAHPPFALTRILVLLPRPAQPLPRWTGHGHICTWALFVPGWCPALILFCPYYNSNVIYCNTNLLLWLCSLNLLTIYSRSLLDRLVARGQGRIFLQVHFSGPSDTVFFASLWNM